MAAFSVSQVTLNTAPPAAGAGAPLIAASGVNLHYGSAHALKNIALTLGERHVTAFIGPSGCGKSTFLRCFNRMNDLIDSVRITGKIEIGGQDIYSPDVDVIELRKRVGMVFQKSNPFPKSIYENIAYGLRLHGMKAKAELDAAIERGEAFDARCYFPDLVDREPELPEFLRTPR